MLALGFVLANFLGTVFDVKGVISEMARSNKYFKQYDPEVQKLLVEEIKKYYGTSISDEKKNAIQTPMDKTLSLFREYQNHRDMAFDDAPLAHKYQAQVDAIKAMDSATNHDFEQAEKRLEEDTHVFKRLVDDIGKSHPNTNQVYHASDLATRPYKIRDRITLAMKRQNDHAKDALDEKLAQLNVADFDSQAEMDTFKEQMRSALKTSHEKQLKEVLEPVNESIDALHKAANDQYYELAFIEQQKTLFKELAKIKASEGLDANTVLSYDENGSTLTMYGIDLATLPEDLAKINAAREKKGEKALTITSSSGSAVELKRNDDGTCSISSKIPMALFSPNFHHNPRQHLKDLICTQLSTAIATGMVKGGIVLRVNHKNQKKAEEIAQEQYLAAISMGLKTDQFSCLVNGVPKNSSDMEKMIADSGRGYDLSGAKEQAGRFFKQHAERENALAKADENPDKSDAEKYESRKKDWKQNPNTAAKFHNKELKDMIGDIREAERKVDKSSWITPAPTA